MKKAVATLCIIGTAVALSACSSTNAGTVDSSAPASAEASADAGYAKAQNK